MRLTAELVGRCTGRINAVREWELLLRGFKIPAIENTGTTKVQQQRASVYTTLRLCLTRPLPCVCMSLYPLCVCGVRFGT